MIFLLKTYKAGIPEFLKNIGISGQTADYLENIIVFLIVVFLAIVSHIIFKKIIIRAVQAYVTRSKTQIDDIFFEKKIFHRIAYLAPAAIIYYFSPYIFDDSTNEWIEIFQKISEVYTTVVIIMVITSFLNALNVIYDKFSKNKNITIKGYIQIANIIIVFIGILVTISVLFNINLIKIFTGLGAFAAILMLIFQDSIKGLVGGIMLSLNDMVHIGDWITMNKYGADGIVIDVSLNIVKVQNWDKTITTIPTYSMVTESFSNWRGMEESGGRRIKRSVFIDIKSVKFLSQEEMEKFKSFNHLKEYIEAKQKEIAEVNSRLGIDNNNHINGKSLTNIGTFRVYLENYLRNNENIRTDMTFLVRQLQPTEKGVPVEIYVFSKVQEWAKYEKIQSDIFDHIFAIVPYFDLRIFQNPSGDDIKSLSLKLH